MGFEPMTSCLLDRRSNQLSYGASVKKKHVKNEAKCITFRMKMSEENLNSFSYERLCHKTRFEKEVQDRLGNGHACWKYKTMKCFFFGK